MTELWVTPRARAQHQRRVAEAMLLENAAELAEANRQLQKANREMEERNARLVRMANTDPLNGIPNRRHFMACLEQEVARIDRQAAHLSAALLDVDHFK